MDETDKCLDRFQKRVREAAPVKLTRQLIAALMLIAWLFAGAHVAVEHGGEAFGFHSDEAAHGEHHHDDDHDAPGDSDHHRHDLGAVTSATFTKSAEKQILAPQWVPLFSQFVAHLAAMLHGTELEQTLIDDAPPDERASGWLLVCQTALQVRGPSLAV